MSEKTISQVNPWIICGRIIFTIALAATILFIFSNSREVAEVSSSRSQEVLETAQEVLVKVGQKSLAEKLTEHIIRKLGHFSEYMLEGFWLMLCVRVYTKHFVKHISWPILIGLLTAMCDETIQMFTMGRSPQLTDVWIDFFGMMTGLFVGFILLCLFRMFAILFKHRNED